MAGRFLVLAGVLFLLLAASAIHFLSGESEPGPSTSSGKAASDPGARPGDTLLPIESPLSSNAGRGVATRDQKDSPAATEDIAIMESAASHEEGYRLGIEEIVGGIEQALVSNDPESLRMFGELIVDGMKMSSPCDECASRIASILQDDDADLAFRVIAARILSRLGTREAVSILLGEALKTLDRFDEIALLDQGDVSTLLRYEIISALAENLDSPDSIRETADFLAGVGTVPLPPDGLPVDVLEPLLEGLRNHPQRDLLNDVLVEAYRQTGSETGRRNILAVDAPEVHARLALLMESYGDFAARDELLDALFEKASRHDTAAGIAMIAARSEMTARELESRIMRWSDLNVGQYSLKPFERILANREASRKSRIAAITAIGEALEVQLSIQILEKALKTETDPEIRKLVESQLALLRETADNPGAS